MWASVTDPVEIRRECLEVMAVSPAVYVSTLDEDGAPCTRAMFNLRRGDQFPSLGSLFSAHDETLLVLLSTNTSSEKVRHLSRDPRVSLYYCVPETFHGVMLSGSVLFEPGLDLRRTLWQQGWEIYFPSGVEDPDFTVLSVIPRRIRGWLGDRSFDAVIGA